MIKLSIILPVYNVEKYIVDCLESLLYQDISKEEYEIICVDDGSPDKSKFIIEQYIQKYPNIFLISKENGGVSSARNAGMQEAKGKYIWFVDPDDMIQSNSLKFIIDSLEKHNADLIEISMRTCAENSHDFIEMNEFKIDKFNYYACAASACVYIIKRSLLIKNDIYWNETLHYGEDYLYAFLISNLAKAKIFSKSKIYIYRQRPSSAMNDKSIENIIKHMNSLLNLAIIYKSEKSRFLSDRKIIKDLDSRIDLCVQSILMDLLLARIPKLQAQTFFKTLKLQKLYPYHIIWIHLLPSINVNHTIINWISLLFPIEWYLKILIKIRCG